MIQRKFPIRGTLLAVAVCLAACAPTATKPVLGGGPGGQAAREAQLRLMPTWSFTGRVAISNAGEGGNARIAWTQRGEDFDVTLSAPVTRQSWRLTRRGGRARLEGLEGGSREGADAEALLLEATGWRIPVASLADWVRGARSGPAAELEFAPNGLPSLLVETGWTVEYRAWSEAQPPLPLRLFARRQPATVRLVIERWATP